jgi:DNA invertase Pin-like site-specific DNA recombinase
LATQPNVGSRSETKAAEYARVSSQDQNIDPQIAALRAEGVDKILREKAIGKDMRNSPEIERAIDTLATKGGLVLAEWDRATRSLMDGIHIMETTGRVAADNGIRYRAGALAHSYQANHALVKSNSFLFGAAGGI